MQVQTVVGKRAARDALILVVVGVVLGVLCQIFDVYETIEAFSRANDHLGLNHVVEAANIVALLCLIYALRRLTDLKRESQRRTEAERRVDWLSSHDALTGLPNRRALVELQQALVDTDDPGHYVIFSIDLDRFKKINDLVGHQGGDLLLKDVADRLRKALPGALVYRVGGDEFLLVHRRSGSQDCLRLGYHILKILSAPYDVGGMTSDIGASIGFALFPEDSSDLDDAMHCADVAMYVAKKAGHNGVCGFERIMEDRVVRRAETELALKQAIRNQAIVPYYQPLIDLSTGAVRGFEALARWKTGPNHFVPPGDFIELAETSGMIVELSDNLLRMACRDALDWPETCRLAFNISPAQFVDRQLGLRIMNILLEVGLPAQRLEIEITETALMQDMETAAGILADLQASGIRIALDDFGTGYSSLSQLSKFHFDKIKIDRSFVMGFQSDKRQEDIVRAIMGLSKGLGIITTAEGIEEPDQLDFLKSIGCDFGQGFLFGKALPPDEALRMAQTEADEGSGSPALALPRAV